ncbi:hypothetical protein WJX75_008213 [Coccomyxa subellipsoidea]|uniref:Uncharacterized protein n=1 Tax=Coccomyxa subellipsoidea TaxID=248742 RepID=A0ABR2YYU9_9CHLO
MTELKAIQLDSLLDELNRIQGQQELDDEDDDKPAEKAPPKYVVSGGLTGFGVAQDLLHIDFSPPEEAPKEFKAMPFNSKRLTTLKSGLSGTFGKVDAMSEILTEYLQRLEEQQESVMQLIKNQRQFLKDGKAGAHLQVLKSAAAKV